ncbi:MAG: hypothetical protein FWE47_00320 [Oscillospiraceae bacterium]|nr:hypothetical protein [Oscillospiraceae bacterium]
MKKILCGSIATIFLGGAAFLIFCKKNLENCCNSVEESSEKLIKSIVSMDSLLEAEDLFNGKDYAESFNKINCIDEDLLTNRGRTWLYDLENAIKQKVNI